MKLAFVLLCIVLLLLSLSDAKLVASPSQPPVMSPTSEPSTTLDCSSVIYSMVDCLSFLTVGSTDPSPTQTCCGGIKTVLEYNPKCLCSALESSRDMGFNIDDTKALAMPKTCNVHIDPHCDVSTTPAASTPISSPVKPPTTSPSPAKPPVKTPSPPAKTPSPPTKTPSPPAKTPSPPKVGHSSPARTVSSSPPETSPSPSPSVSSTGMLSVSKLFLAVGIVSCFGFFLA